MVRVVNKRSKGFSLAEAMIATVILSIAVAGILLPFTSGMAVRAAGERRTLAAGLAADLMERIVNTPFDDIVGNYNYSEAQGQVTDAAGVVFTDPAYLNFSRSSDCEYVYVPQESGDTDARFILATVRVYYNAGEVAVVKRLISR